MIDLDSKSLNYIRTVFSNKLPSADIRVFGSRATGKAKKYSDLDIAIIDEQPVTSKTLSELRETFSNSDLPISVDIVDWHTISKEFQEAIANDCISLF